MYFEKNIFDLIYSFDNTYKELFDIVMKELIKIRGNDRHYSTFNTRIDY